LFASVLRLNMISSCLGKNTVSYLDFFERKFMNHSQILLEVREGRYFLQMAAQFLPSFLTPVMISLSSKAVYFPVIITLEDPSNFLIYGLIDILTSSQLFLPNN